MSGNTWSEEDRRRGLKIAMLLSEHYPEEISFLPVISPFRFLVTVMLSASTTDRQAEAAAQAGLLLGVHGGKPSFCVLMV